MNKVPSTHRYMLLFSDLEVGCHQLGWMPRLKKGDADDEDLAYERFVRKTKGIRAKVAGMRGYAIVTSEPET